MFHLGDDIDGVEGDIVGEIRNYIDHTCILPELYLGKKEMYNAKFRFLHRGHEDLAAQVEPFHVQCSKMKTWIAAKEK